MNTSVFITIIFLCLQRSFAATFSTNSFVTYQWETQLNSLAVEEFDINGTVLQKIALPSYVFVHQLSPQIGCESFLN